MRIEHVTSKVRPIKKMFVLEQKDINSIKKILGTIYSEIDAPFNIIFTNSDDLFSDATSAFVKRSDPDLILNFSLVENDKLSQHFGVASHTPDNELYTIQRFGTNLFSFTASPTILDYFKSDDERNTFESLAIRELDNTDFSLFAAVNFDVLTDETLKHLDHTIFKGIQRKVVNTVEETVDHIYNGNAKFVNITRTVGGLSGSGYGSSIYEIDYNTVGHFKGEKKYVVISKSDDVRSIGYFWNTRSYYPYANLFWLPATLVDSFKQMIIENEVTVVILDEQILEEYRDKFAGQTILLDQLYFEGPNERWAIYNHSQSITIAANDVHICHPANKTFSALGMSGAVV